MIRKSHIAVAVAALISAPAFAAVGFDANVELDSSYHGNNRGAAQTGRVELNAYSKTDKGGGFVAGRASYMAGKGGTATVDDMWVQIGNASGDIKLGRFEAADLFPLGKDVIVEDGGTPSGYRSNVFRGRSGDGLHGALNLNVGGGIGFELGLIAKGEDNSTAATATTAATPDTSNKNNVGLRPVVSFAANGFTAKVGFETGKTTGSAKVNGVGLTVGTTMAGAGLNVNFSSGKVGGLKGSSLGVNATFGPAGVGFIHDRSDKATGGTGKENTVYAAYSLPLFDTGATITPAASYGKATGEEKRVGLRVRINYAF